MHRRWVKAAIAVVALVVVVAALIPLLINADTFRPKVEAELSRSLGRKVTLGHLSFSLLAGSLVANNISIADDPAFAATPFLQARRLHLGIALGPFLFHHLVHITDFTVDSPEIRLIHAETGTWNFSSLGGAATSRPAPQQDTLLPALSVAVIKIKGGTATLSSVPASGKPLQCTDFNLAIQQFSFSKSFPFQLSLKVPGDGSLQLSGAAGPVAQNDAARTPFHATLQLKHFDPVVAGVVQPAQGVSMLADFDAQLVADGNSLTSTGKIQAARLQLARGGSPAPQPVEIDYTISDNLVARTGQVADISIHSGSVAGHANGSYRYTPQGTVLDLRFSAPNLPIDQLEELLPAFGVRLPSGSHLRGGTVSATLAITGPAADPEIAGPVEIDNTQLSGFDLGSKIQGINPLGGTSGGTEIQQLRADLRNIPQTTQLTNIYASVPQIGTASGSGSVADSGALDFQLIAKFNNASAIGALANKGTGALEALLGNRSGTAATNGVPLTITGTTSAPSIHANVGSMLKQEAKGLFGNSAGQQKTTPAELLKGLFGK